MRVRRDNHVRPRMMHAGMNRKRRAVQRMFAFHNFALGVDQHQVGDPNLTEVHAERIDPEMVWLLGIARRDVPRDAFVEAEFRKKAERSGETLFAMPALFRDAGEFGRSRKRRSFYWRGSH